ncbi:MAG: hypothetical protein ACFB5Z_08885 [Elainellaceae cyanobacterium]
MQRLFGMSFGLLAMVAIASAAFFYIVSPVDHPSFDPVFGAGPLVPWLKGVGEAPWLIGASALAILLASNLVVLLWGGSRSKLSQLQARLRQGWQRKLAQAASFMFWLALGFVLFSGIWLAFMHYLLSLWIVD